MISPSRIFDLSSMIHQLVRLLKYVSFDQLQEYLYIATMQNAPGRFYVITEFLLRHYYESSCYNEEVSLHPYYLYQEVGLKVFAVLQGGPHHWYRSFGGELHNIFEFSRFDKEGVKKLKKLTKILLGIID